MLKVPDLVPARPLAVFRIVVGLSAAVKGLEYAGKSLFYADPEPLYDFLPDLPRTAWAILTIPMVAAGVLLVLGIRTRLAALVAGLITLAFISGAYYVNHTYMLATLALMLALTDSGAALSPRSRRGSGTEQVWGPPVYLLRAQISIVYIYAALSKINIDFLSGNVLAWAGFQSMFAPNSIRIMPLLMPMAIGSVAVEIFIGIGLWVPRLRPLVVRLGVLLHFGMVVFISPNLVAAVDLVLFAALMIAGYGLFYRPLPEFFVRVVSGTWRRIIPARSSAMPETIPPPDSPPSTPDTPPTAPGIRR